MDRTVPSRGRDESLNSWNPSPAKEALVTFVRRVTSPKARQFVPVSARIAVFDNDGTLWPENPMPIQLAYALDALKGAVENQPELGDDPMVRAGLDGDMAKLVEGPRHEGLLRILALTHAGMTTDDFRACVERWLDGARHPRYEVPYTRLTYQPMQELLAYLRANGFKTFIVSAGGADFMRALSAAVYAIPPEQVVGSIARTRMESTGESTKLVKTSDHLFVDNGDGKPVAIHAFIGRRPIACFGNSDGDVAMLDYATLGNPYPAFGMIVHHTDARREYAYDAKPSSTGKLVDGLRLAERRGWAVVDMSRDWNRVFERSPAGT